MQIDLSTEAGDMRIGSSEAADDRADSDSLWSSWQKLRETQKIRARDAAVRLGVSEAELVDCNPASQRLTTDWGAIIQGLHQVGPVMALTRNHGVVIEKTGLVQDVEIYPQHRMGQVVGTDVDLRLFLRHWEYGFALGEEPQLGLRGSLQFFDAAGVAVHKVHRVEGTDADAWAALVASHADPAPRPLHIGAPEQLEAPVPDAAIDIDGLRAGWLGMSNTHDFFGLLRKFQAERRQALRLVGLDLARPVAANSYRAVLEFARDSGLELMVFVGNPGCLQIHTGPLKHLETVGQWFNITDPGFNLHLWQPAVTDAWLVRKPTDQGVITSLECYDDAGELLLQCFGKRKGEASESARWRDLLGTACNATDFVGA